MEAFKAFLGIKTGIETFYWLLALTGSFLFIVKIILAVIGSEADADADVDMDVDIDLHADLNADIDADIDGDIDTADDADIDIEHDSILTIDTIISFLNGAGWIGVICIRYTKITTLMVIPITMATGLVTLYFAYFLIKKLKTLESSSTIDNKSAIGNVGTVYLTIPPAGEGKGQIQVDVQGRLKTVDAKSDKGELKTGEKILVCYIDKKDNIYVVAPFKHNEKISY